MGTDQVAVVVLAAGASRRYGGIKLLTPVGGGEPLLRRSARIALETGLGPVVVVLGANRVALNAVLDDLPVEPVINPDWADGMGRSIAVGVWHLTRRHPELSGALIVPADLPGLPADHLCALVLEARRRALPAAATAGPAGLLQAPAYFSRGLFPVLEALDRDRGARHILRRDPSAVAAVTPPFPLEDLDRP